MKKKTRKSNTNQSHIITLYIIIALLAMLAGVLYVWHPAKTITNQLPQKQYDSYEDCVNNGGILLVTINAQFDGCLGGDLDETGEIPQHQAFLQYSAKNLPNISERKTSDTENRVSNTENYSADLVNFLKNDASGCDPRGEYEIIDEVPDRFALMKYGCDGDGQVQSDSPPTIIAIKLADGWSFISPTNNMEDGVPSCLLQDIFKVSKELAPTCFENTGHDNYSLSKRNYP